MKKRALSLLLIFAMVLSILPQISIAAEAAAVNDYTQWKQGDPEWNQSQAWTKTDYPYATMFYMSECGCLVTSIAMLLRHYNVVISSDVSTFNPWICNEALKAAKAFDDEADLIFENVAYAYPGMKYIGCVGYSLTTLQNLFNDGYACVVKVNGSGGYYHYVAVRSISGDNVSIMDPGGSATNLDAYGSKYEIYYYAMTPACTHNYNNLGICQSTCKSEYNWQATYDTSCAGIYKVSLSGGIYLRTDKPYSASTAKSDLIKNGTEVKVLGSVNNHYETDNKWYKVSYNAIEGYTNANNLTWVKENDKQPLATCDEVVEKNGSVYIRGWAFDPDTPSESVAIHVYIDDALAGAYTANTSRPDVHNVYGCGNYHGFEFAVPCSTGSHSVIVFAVNTTYGESPRGMGPFNVTVSSHTHSYTSKVTTAAGCTTAGVRTYTCSGCGASYTESIAATGHSYGNWTTTKAPTCTGTGTQQKKCTKCSATQTQNIAAKGHSYSDWVTTAAAGCTTTGTQKKTCSSCSDVQTQSIAATGHNYQSTIIDATCSEYEKIRYTCCKCQHYYEEYTNEKYSDWSATKPTGVAENLIETKTQYRYRNITYSTEYTSWGSWSSWQDSSVSETTLRDVETRILYPYYYYYCKKCGDGTRWYAYGGNCGACGTTMVSSSGTVVWLTTPWSEAVPYQPFGYDTGKYAIHIDGLTYWKWTDGSPKTQYRYRTRTSCQVTNYGSWSSWGDTAYTSSSSREVQTRTVYRYVNAQLGDHVWMSSKITTQPTCTTDGVRTYYCDYCDATKTELISATRDHEWGTWATIVEATCKQEGTQKRNCGVCGESQEQTVSVTGHNYGQWQTVIAPTCKSPGTKAHSCSVCGNEESELVAAKGHNYVSLTVEPQCETQGYTQYGCYYCYDYYEDTYVPALGHQYENGYCTRCDEKDPDYWVITQIKLATLPIKVEYLTGETLDTTGLSLTSIYRDGSTETITEGFTVSGFDFTTPGTQTLTVTYEGLTVTFGVTVEKPVLFEIVTQPADSEITAGYNARFTVEATDAASYKWQYRRNQNAPWVNTTLTGHATDTLTVPAILARDGYQYRCRITGNDGTVLDTEPATLTVNESISIITQPTRQIVGVDTNAVYTVETDGAGLTYQWLYRKHDEDFWKQTGMTGNKTATLTVPAIISRNGYQYMCAITDENGIKINSKVAVLSAIGFTVQPADQTAAVDTNAVFTVAAKGQNLTYKWQYRKSSTSAWLATSLPGFDTDTLTVQATTSRNGYQYRCGITDALGTLVYSDVATLTVGSGIKIITQPTNQTAPVSQIVVFTVDAAGDNLTYQWQYRKSASGSWINTSLTGAKTDTLTVQVLKGRHEYQYRCVITDASGVSVYTNAATLTVFNIVTQPADRTVAVDTNAVFTVSATGTGLTYQWQYRKSADGNWMNTSLTGYKTAKLTVQALESRDGYQYRCIITDAKGNKLTTEAATLTIK